ncbi:pirin family protein [Aestuariirhabdus sp. Z084]|uniref:pirin family protein n=1 Tax=Aestuariirhabdus haliotis TaxID=2918751 RepID=UPI00201B36BC|nr:pirin family protein [Aestuariirhabdus haliotis]MCL6415507.1 pirin family protein [Aestuariirhabdus haliotis]MCL6419288.1 pirin family protein [Aestuariirhabdus haliotis]
MLVVRKGDDRGAADFGWLRSRHSFSFGSYYDPQHMGVSTLRVINDDWVAPSGGFDTHGHRDMEIISVVLAGVIEHQDTMGHQHRLQPGDVQVMSAGTGVQHSEYNASAQEPLQFLQIWIEPDTHGLKPSYAQQHFGEAKGQTLLASRDARDGSLPIHQDADIYQLVLDAGEHSIPLSEGRTCYLHLYQGELSITGPSNNAETLTGGDAVTITNEGHLDLQIKQPGVKALLFDLP